MCLAYFAWRERSNAHPMDQIRIMIRKSFYLPPERKSFFNIFLGKCISGLRSTGTVLLDQIDVRKVAAHELAIRNAWPITKRVDGTKMTWAFH
jgi:hypothetical protein